MELNKKFVVIFKILITYLPLLFLLTYFNWFITTKLFGINYFQLISIWYKWYQYLGFIMLQWVYFSLVIGLIIGLVRAIKRNKEFFLS
jgi:hypothetical protein